MKKVLCVLGKVLLKLCLVVLVGFVVTFTIYMTNAENKLIYYVVRPLLNKHYDSQVRDRRVQLMQKRRPKGRRFQSNLFNLYYFIMYFVTDSGISAGSAEMLVTKLMFSALEKASSHVRKVTSVSTDLSLTSL